MSDIERTLAEKCASFGLPPSFDTLMRHMENNHAATLGAQRDHIETLTRQLAGAVDALAVAIGEGQCADGHAWADGFVVHCGSCAKVARLANRVGGQ